MKSDMEVDNMKFKKTIIISIVISVILLICSLLLPNINIDKDTIGYNGNDTYNIKAYNTIRDINKYIKISDNIDKKMLGNYQVTVKVRYLFYRYNQVFDIKVVDKVKPEVELQGNNPSYVCPNKDYDEEGYTASDDYDGDITDKVNIEKNGNFIIYSVKDSSGNKNEIRRSIIFEDKEEPSLTLIGDNNIVIYKNSKYIDHAAEKIIPQGLSKTREVHKGDFLLSNSMSFGRPYILKIDGAVHDGWLILSNYNKVFDKNYLYYLLSSNVAMKQFLFSAMGSTVKNLNSARVANTIGVVPPISEQRRIVARIEQLFTLLN